MMNRIDQQFGNYRLVRFLGQGGFAEVYLGEHVLMGSSAAIKILNAQLVSTDSQRFIQEARTLVTLEHPRIVRVKECGIEGGIPFLVIDYAPNGTLRQRHSSGTRVPLDYVVSYVTQIASALQYAHDLRFIHRDVKPENMLVGRSGEVLLSDFGIAVISASSSIRYTKDSAGTAIYMAPEQIERQAQPASDQYALGIVVYEWLCGEVPFQGSFGEITARHLHARPPSFREKGLSVPAVVEGIVMRALAKKPEERFPSVKEFALALQQSSPQQMTYGSQRDNSRDGSLILADSDQPAPYTVHPVVQPQPLTPANTPPLARATPPLVSPGVPPQAFTPPLQPQSAYPAQNVPPTTPGGFYYPTVPAYPTRRKKRHALAWIISAVIIGAIVVGSVYIIPKIITSGQGSNPPGGSGSPVTSPGVTPQVTSNPGVTPSPSQTPAGPTPTAQTPPSSGSITIKTASLTVNGKTVTVLTNSQGLTLYYRTSDSASSVCSGGCASVWPPILSSSVPATSTTLPGKLTVVTNANGSQVEYNGHPLYTYSGDSGPGQANGEGFGGVWFVVTTDLAA